MTGKSKSRRMIGCTCSTH